MAKQTKHILAVDDNRGVREVVVLMLEEYGYRVTAANDGISMREMLRQYPGIDAIVLDALMPGERSAALALHARALGIPVVMISGSLEEIKFAREKGLQMLKKPFRCQELVDALSNAFDSGEAGRESEGLDGAYPVRPQGGRNSDEPMFVLLGRDRHAAVLVRLWALLRHREGEDAGKTAEALKCADTIDDWQQSLGRKPVENSGRFEPLLIAATDGMAAHPERYEWPCACDECCTARRGYG
jgi:CheY-like chemotaxis protein